ncbi:T9SS type A sorting domain-containing protein [Hymenobacter algoricola]|uniref:Secretion system C-terminal sorting domain-containing protein n=1 Tax=Hymenobacter algoricola TaxID=486267 RepID=A0ABP7MWZ5_9BACT
MKTTLTLLAGLVLAGAGAQAQAQALTGTVTVGGANPTYATLTAAATALQTNGVGPGGVTVAVRPGTYPERLVLSTITGSSATSRIRFVGRGGSVTLQPVGTSGTTDAAVLITACDYLTLDSLNVTDGGSSATDQVEVGVSITGTGTKGSTNVTVSNCAIRLGGGPAPAAAPGSRGVQIVSAATAASGANNNNRIVNVRVDRASTGIRLAGVAAFSGAPTFTDSGNEVIGCVLGSQRFIGLDGSSGTAAGISAAAQRRMRLVGNRIDSVLIRNASPILPVSAAGFSFDNSSGLLESNRVGYVRFAGTGGSQVQGIRASVILGDTLKVFNNFIGGIQRLDFTAGTTDNTLYAQGIWLFRQTGGGGLTQAFHNTIVLPAAPAPVAYSSAGFYLTGGSGGLFPAQLRNNIIINRLSTSVATQNALAVVDGNTTRGNLTSVNNVLLTPGTNGAIGQTGRELGGTRITSTTLADWQTNSTYDAGSVSRLVSFVNEAAGDLHLAGASVGDFALASPPLAAVPRDIDGALRNVAATYRGADEASFPLRTQAAQAALLHLQAYPNPTANRLALGYQQDVPGTAHFIVLDAVGRPVRTLTSPHQPAGMQQQELDLSKLAAGVYLVQVNVPVPNGARATATVRVSVIH